MPDARIAWSDVWIGSAVTTLLFIAGKFLIGLYIRYSAEGSAYGAAGSLVVLMLWVYYSAQIFLMGAEFTKVYAERFGSRIRPEDGARAVHEKKRPDSIHPHFHKFAILGEALVRLVLPSGRPARNLFHINDKRANIGKLNWLKYLIFLAIIFIPLIFAIRSAGGLTTIDFFYYTDHGISIAKQGAYTI